MASPGPIPKRSEERIRRNVDETGPVERVAMSGFVAIPELGSAEYVAGLHPIAVDLYNSLAESGQSKYYEPSDWQMARVLVHMLSGVLDNSKPSAQMIASLSSLMSSLLLTEGERRRVRLEVDRASEAAEVVNIARILEERMKSLRGA